MIINRRRGTAVGLLVLLCLMWGCKTKPPSDSLATYMQTKRGFAEELGKQLGMSADKYRIVAVTGPQWKVGTALDPQNPASEITRACIVKSENLPESLPWAGLPEYTTTQTIDFAAGVPTGVANVFKRAVDANVSLDWQRGGRYALRDLSQVVLAEDEFLNALLSDSCGNGLKGKKALLVRGVISGKELFGSTNKLAPGAAVKVQDFDVLKLTYVNSESYELEDKEKSAKFFVFTLIDGGSLAAAARGPIEPVAPSQTSLDSLEAINLSKP
jgi:hypothetical protein